MNIFEKCLFYFGKFIYEILFNIILDKILFSLFLIIFTPVIYLFCFSFGYFDPFKRKIYKYTKRVTINIETNQFIGNFALLLGVILLIIYFPYSLYILACSFLILLASLSVEYYQYIKNKHKEQEEEEDFFNNI